MVVIKINNSTVVYKKRLLFVIVLLILSFSTQIGKMLRSNSGTFHDLFLKNISVRDLQYISISLENEQDIYADESAYPLFYEFFGSLELKTDHSYINHNNFNNKDIYIKFNDETSILIRFYNDKSARIKGIHNTSANYIFKEPVDFY